MELNDFMNLQQISTTDIQASTACLYLGRTIKTRTQLLRINGHHAIFKDWSRMQEWLMDNYFTANSKVEAELKLSHLTMYSRESIQDFINHFETIMTDLAWDDTLTCFSFRSKLTPKVLDNILQSHLNGYPEDYPSMKQAAQQAENHLKLGKRAREDHEYNAQKRVRFANSQTSSYQNRPRSPFQEKSNNAGFRTNNNSQNNTTFCPTSPNRTVIS